MSLTAPQRKALLLLASRDHCSPAEIGEELSDREHLTAQGAGRIGGTMGTRLVRMGLAFHASHRRNGFPAYAITKEGREALVVHQ